MAIKVLFAVPQAHPVIEPALERLRAAGCELLVNATGRKLSEQEMIERVPGVFGTIAGVEPYTERVFAAAPQLKVVARMGVGHDQIDVGAATRHGVAIAMAFGTNHEAVADHAFALMAALGNRVLGFHSQVLAGAWGGRFQLGLWRTTVGIIGLGRIGRALARRCRGFDMRILAYDIAPDAAYAQAHGIELVDLETLFKDADFVSVHAPLTPETHKIVGRQHLALMKPSAFLINTARGGLVDEAALCEALIAGKIAGAGLDVFEVEPLPEDSPLRRMDHVVLTPHCAGGSVEAVVAMANRAVDNILAVRDGRRPSEGVLNPEALAG
jgi:D-3-phosphoglycerate dehydrogenase / 2-oxoglutarate reductase